MKKIAIIDSCEKCPHIGYKYGRCGDVYGYLCEYFVKTPQDHPRELPQATLFDFPEWCPLDDLYDCLR